MLLIPYGRPCALACVVPSHHHPMACGLLVGEQDREALLSFSLALSALQVLQGTQFGESGMGPGELDLKVFHSSPRTEQRHRITPATSGPRRGERQSDHRPSRMRLAVRLSVRSDHGVALRGGANRGQAGTGAPCAGVLVAQQPAAILKGAPAQRPGSGRPTYARSCRGCVGGALDPHRVEIGRHRPFDSSGWRAVGTEEKVDEALIDLLWAGARTGRFDASPLAGRWSVVDGERAQLEVLSRWVELGCSRAGWKVGLTSGAVRDSFGPGVRPFGFLLRERVFDSGAVVRLDRMSRPGIETELCFRVGRRLAGDADPDDVERAVEWVAPSFELNERRIDGLQDPGIRVADNLTQWGVVLGRPLPSVPPRSVLTSVVVGLHHEGRLVESVAADGYLDDPYLSIARLARELAAFGLAVEEGDLVITSSLAILRADASTAACSALSER